MGWLNGFSNKLRLTQFLVIENNNNFFFAKVIHNKILAIKYEIKAHLFKNPVKQFILFQVKCI